MKSTSIRVLIVDDHPVVRFGLSRALSDEPDLDVVGDAAEADDAVKQLQAHAPDVIILDLELGHSHGVEALGAIRKAAPSVSVIVYTAYSDADRVAEAAELGF